MSVETTHTVKWVLQESSWILCESKWILQEITNGVHGMVIQTDIEQVETARKHSMYGKITFIFQQTLAINLGQLFSRKLLLLKQYSSNT